MYAESDAKNTQIVGLLSGFLGFFYIHDLGICNTGGPRLVQYLGPGKNHIKHRPY